MPQISSQPDTQASLFATSINAPTGNLQILRVGKQTSLNPRISHAHGRTAPVGEGHLFAVSHFCLLDPGETTKTLDISADGQTFTLVREDQSRLPMKIIGHDGTIILLGGKEQFFETSQGMRHGKLESGNRFVTAHEQPDYARIFAALRLQLGPHPGMGGGAPPQGGSSTAAFDKKLNKLFNKEARGLIVASLQAPFSLKLGSIPPQQLLEFKEHLSHLRQIDLIGCKNVDAYIPLLKQLGAGITFLDLRDTSATDATLQSVLPLPQLETLVLGNTAITGACMTAIAQCAALRQLSLTGTGLRDDDIVPMPGLERLSLCKTLVTDKIVNKLAAFEKLAYVSLQSTALTDACAQAFGQLAHFKSVDLDDTQIGDKVLEVVAGFTGLTHLYVNHTKVTAQGLNRLTRVAQLTVLGARGIDASGLNPSLVLQWKTTLLALSLKIDREESAGEILQRVGQCQELKHLYLYGSGIADGTILPLSAMRNVIKLALDGCAVTDGALETIVQMKKLQVVEIASSHVLSSDFAKNCKKKLPQLRTCEVLKKTATPAASTLSSTSQTALVASTPTPLSKAQTTVIKPADFDAALEQWRFESRLAYPRENWDRIKQRVANSLNAPYALDLNGIPAASLSSFTPHLAHVVHVDLGGCKQVRTYFPVLKNLAGLTSLDLQRTDVTDSALKDLLPLQKLENVWLGSTKVTGKTMQLLALCPRLRTLCLRDTGIKDRDLVPIDTLTTLNLARTKVTNAGLDRLAGFSKLSYLSLQGTALTDEAAGQFRRMAGRLISIDVADTKIGGQTLEVFADCSKLQMLNVNNTEAIGKHLNAIERCTSLHTLEAKVFLYGLQFMSDGTLWGGRPRELELDVNHVPPTQLSWLFEALGRSGNLTALTLWNLGDLSVLTSLQGLTKLRLEQCAIDLQDIDKIGQLKNLRELSVVHHNMWGDRLTDHSMWTWNSMLPNLTSVSFERSLITRKGLNELLRNQRIEIIKLRGASIREFDDADVAHFLAGRRKHLDLRDNPLDHESIRRLEDLRQQGHDVLYSKSRSGFDWFRKSARPGDSFDRELTSWIAKSRHSHPHFDWPAIRMRIEASRTPPFRLRLHELPAELLPPLAIHLEHVRQIDLAGCDRVAEFVPFLKKLEKVDTIDLSYSNVTDALLERFLPHKRLESINLNGTAITKKGMKTLAKCTNLARLWLAHTALADDDVIPMPKLCRLALDRTRVGNGVLTQLAKFKNLTWVSLRGTRIDDHAAPQIDRLWSMTKYSIRLDLSDTQIGPRVLEKIVSKEHHFVFTNVSRTQFLSTGWKALLGSAPVTEANEPTLLILQDIDTANLEPSLFKSWKKSLSVLEISVTDAPNAAAILGEIARCRSLKVLRLSGTGVTDATIQPVLQLPNLAHLVIRNAAITDASAASLGQMSSLQLLDIDGTATPLTDAFVEACVAPLPRLVLLRLQGTAITEKGLARLIDHPGLQGITLGSTALQRLPQQFGSSVRNQAERRFLLTAENLNDNGRMLIRQLQSEGYEVCHVADRITLTHASLDSTEHARKFLGLLHGHNISFDALFADAVRELTLPYSFSLQDFPYVASAPLRHIHSAILHGKKQDIAEAACRQAYQHYQQAETPSSIDATLYRTLLQRETTKHACLVLNAWLAKPRHGKLPGTASIVSTVHIVVSKIKAQFQRQLAALEEDFTGVDEHLIAGVATEIWQRLQSLDDDSGQVEHISDFSAQLEDHAQRIFGLTKAAVDAHAATTGDRTDAIVRQAVDAFMSEFLLDEPDTKAKSNAIAILRTRRLAAIDAQLKEIYQSVPCLMLFSYLKQSFMTMFSVARVARSGAAPHNVELSKITPGGFTANVFSAAFSSVPGLGLAGRAIDATAGKLQDRKAADWHERVAHLIDPTGERDSIVADSLARAIALLHREQIADPEWLNTQVEDPKKKKYLDNWEGLNVLTKQERQIRRLAVQMTGDLLDELIDPDSALAKDIRNCIEQAQTGSTMPWETDVHKMGAMLRAHAAAYPGPSGGKAIEEWYVWGQRSTLLTQREVQDRVEQYLRRRDAMQQDSASTRPAPSSSSALYSLAPTKTFDAPSMLSVSPATLYKSKVTGIQQVRRQRAIDLQLQDLYASARSRMLYTYLKQAFLTQLSVARVMQTRIAPYSIDIATASGAGEVAEIFSAAFSSVPGLGIAGAAIDAGMGQWQTRQANQWSERVNGLLDAAGDSDAIVADTLARGMALWNKDDVEQDAWIEAALNHPKRVKYTAKLGGLRHLPQTELYLRQLAVQMVDELFEDLLDMKSTLMQEIKHSLKTALADGAPPWEADFYKLVPMLRAHGKAYPNKTPQPGATIDDLFVWGQRDTALTYTEVQDRVDHYLEQQEKKRKAKASQAITPAPTLRRQPSYTTFRTLFSRSPSLQHRDAAVRLMYARRQEAIHRQLVEIYDSQACAMLFGELKQMFQGLFAVARVTRTGMAPFELQVSAVTPGGVVAEVFSAAFSEVPGLGVAGAAIDRASSHYQEAKVARWNEKVAGLLDPAGDNDGVVAETLARTIALWLKDRVGKTEEVKKMIKRPRLEKYQAKWQGLGNLDKEHRRLRKLAVQIVGDLIEEWVNSKSTLNMEINASVEQALAKGAKAWETDIYKIGALLRAHAKTYKASTDKQIEELFVWGQLDSLLTQAEVDDKVKRYFEKRGQKEY